MRIAAKTTLSIAALVLGMTVAPDARAGELFLELSEGGQHAYSPTFDPFGRGSTPNVYAVGTATVGFGLDDLIGMPGISAVAVLGRGSTGSKRFDGAYNFQWRRTHYLVGAEFARGLGTGSWIQPFVRMTAGIARQRLVVQPTDGPKFEQYRSPFAFRSSGGLDLHTPFADPESDTSPPLAISEHIAVGGVLQVGYLFQPRQRYDAVRAASSAYDGDSWNRTGFDLGVLDADGWFWQIGASLRWRY